MFERWLKTSRLNKKDCLLIFSVGGGSAITSRNLVLAMEHANSVGASILSVVSRDGGRARELGEVTILIPVVSQDRITPHAEGWQGIIWHLLVNGLGAC